jgi:pantoate--beta-alanine ligase
VTTTVAPALARTRAGMAAARADLPGRVGVVLTMGALHAGHAGLIRAARRVADSVLVTIFVNPLQFGPAEDLDRYPRTLDADLDLCRAEGVSAVFAPTAAEVYPGPPRVRVSAGPLGDVLEGAYRPGHFDGVLTVVLKLLQLTRADVTCFGEKDYQQLTLVRAMVADLNLPVEVVAVPTVREADGLARSSRNRYLSAAERPRALSLPRALAAGAKAADAGRDAPAVLAAARAELTGVEVDYVALTGPALEPDVVAGPARLLVAARVGTTRLIDNAPVTLVGGASGPARA